MATSIKTPADLVNVSLRMIGYKLRVATLYDGSEAAGQALDIYGLARDDFLRDADWQFASRTVASTPIKTAPPNYFDAPWDPATNPPPPWRFEYAYPDDCLKVRQVKFPVGYIFEPDPRPTLMMIANDNAFTPPRRVILSNIEGALIVYTGRVVDLATWPVDAVEAFAGVLGAKLKVGLQEKDLTQIDVGLAAAATQSAMVEHG